MLIQGGTLVQYDWCPYKKKKRDTEGRNHVKSEADWPQVKECRGLPEAGRVREGTSLHPPEASGRAWPNQHPDFGLVASRSMRGYISLVLSHLVLWCFVIAALEI